MKKSNKKQENMSIRFINDDEIRTLNAEHAAKHRRCLFTGFYPIQFLTFFFFFNKLTDDLQMQRGSR